MKLNLLDDAPEGDAQRYVNILTAPAQMFWLTG